MRDDRRGARRLASPQVALAWLLHQPSVTSVIIGAKRPEQLDRQHRAPPTSRSTAEELAPLDEVSALPAEYPGWMLERQGANRAVVPPPR